MKFQKSFISRCASAALSGIMLTSLCVGNICTLTADAANLISNSTFDNSTADWGTYKESGGACSLSVSDGKLALNVSSIGTKTYSVQVFYDIIPLYKNGVYRLKYDISSTVDRYAEGMIQQNGGDYTAYTWKGLDLTSSPLSVDYTFTMEYDTDIMSKLVFNCGNEGDPLPEHTIYIDNVSLELIDDKDVDYSSSRPYEPSIMTNQVGYKCDSNKVAVFRDITSEKNFSVINAVTKEKVFTGEIGSGYENYSAGETDHLGDFSAVTEPGTYYIECGNLDASYTFTIGDDVYGDLLDDSVRMLYLQRCGVAIQDSEFDHPACHTGLAKVYGTDKMIDVSGGWHDAGDYGRYVVPAAKAVADLLYAYEAAPELYGDDLNIPESGNGVPDILDEARFEIEWMLKMQNENGGVHHKVTCMSFPGYVSPEMETDQLIVTPVSSTATADFCASVAMAYEFYKDIDSDFANRCLAAAEKAWNYLEQNPEFDFKNPTDITTGDYGDKSDTDERYWAAAQMYRTTGSEKYLNALNSMSVKKGLDWALVGDYGNIALVTMEDIDKDSGVYKNAKEMIISQADKFASTTESSPYGAPISKFEWGSNMTVANAGIITGLAYQLTGDEKYISSAAENLNYLLGRNPNATCYVTGYGTVSPQNPHHRPSMAKGKAMKGMLVGGVNSSLEDSAAKAYLADTPAHKCYVDNSESYSTNEITIYWNSPLTYLISLMEVAGEENDTPLTGDVNLDGEVNAADLVTLQRFVLGSLTLDESHAESADVNSDGIVNSMDVAVLRKIVLG